MAILGIALVLGPSSTQTVFAQSKGSFDDLVQSGLKSFQERQYAEAAESFRTAYRLRADPTLLYNVGQCFERLARIDDAIAYYEAYLEAPGTTSADRADAVNRIRVLRQEKQERERIRSLPRVEDRPAASTPPALPVLPVQPSRERAESRNENRLPRDLVLIVHSSNKANNLTPVQVRRIYLGKMNAWPDGKRIRAFSRPARSAAGKAFFGSSTGLGIREYRRHWQRMQLTGAALAPASRTNVRTLIREVASTPGAIGFALRSELPDPPKGVRVIALR